VVCFGIAGEIRVCNVLCNVPYMLCSDSGPDFKTGLETASNDFKTLKCR